MSENLVPMIRLFLDGRRDRSGGRWRGRRLGRQLCLPGWPTSLFAQQAKAIPDFSPHTKRIYWL